MSLATKSKFMSAEGLRRNLPASLVVFLVAMPLCLGIAVASGASAEMGLISGAVGGIVVGFLGGAPLQVSGPANGLIVVVSEILQSKGVAALGLAVAIAGALQVLAGFFRVGQLFRAVAPAVILGLLAGFAIVIASGQLHSLMGAVPRGDVISNLKALPESVVGLLDSAWPSLFVGLSALAAILLWRKLATGRAKVIPAYLVAIFVGAGLAHWFLPDVAKISVPGGFLDTLTGAVTRNLQGWSWSIVDFSLVEMALTIAFLASAETLLSATALDRLHTGPRARYNRELMAQGAGNIVCGFLGALPITGVIIRSSANVEAGATSRLSTILHGVWLLLLASLIPGALALVPVPALAAVLLHAVTRLVSPAAIREQARADKANVLIFAATALGIVLFGVLAGVALGIALSLLHLLRRFSGITIEVQPLENQDPTSSSSLIRIAGPASFLSVPRIAEALETVPRGAQVKFDLDALHSADLSCLELLKGWKLQHESSGGTVEMDLSAVENLARLRQRKSQLPYHHTNSPDRFNHPTWRTQS